MASFEFIEDELNDGNGQARFTVFGVGGGGGNAVQHMVQSDIQGVKFVCANTDKQALDCMNAPFKIQLGEQSTRGLGAGANPEVGKLQQKKAVKSFVITLKVRIWFSLPLVWVVVRVLAQHLLWLKLLKKWVF